MRLKLIFLLFLPISFTLNAQNIQGKWKTFDVKTGKEQSVVRLFIENDKLYGEVIEFLGEFKNKNLKCEDCPGVLNDKPLLGMQIINGLKKNGSQWKGKNALFDPETKKYYRCAIFLKEKNVLAVKGFLGPFSETRESHRIM